MTVSKYLSFAAATAMVATSLGMAAPAAARNRGYDGYQGRYDRSYQQNYRPGDYYRGGAYRDSRAYDYRGGYDYRAGYDYRDDYRGYRCRNDGAAGTIIGAIAGGLIGHEVAGRRGDKTAGTIIGGAVGAVAGRAIDKGDGRC